MTSRTLFAQSSATLLTRMCTQLTSPPVKSADRSIRPRIRMIYFPEPMSIITFTIGCSRSTWIKPRCGGAFLLKHYFFSRKNAVRMSFSKVGDS